MPVEEGNVTLAQVLKALTESQDLMRESQSLMRQTQAEQGEAIRSLARRIERCSTSSEAPQAARISLDALEAKITEFYYEPASDITFDVWFNRYEDMFVSDFAVLSDGERIRLLFRHVHLTVEKQYKDFVAPAKITDDTFMNVVQRMRKLFGQRKSLFERRIEFLNLRMSTAATEDLKVLAGMVNRAVHNADIILCKDDSSDQFRAEVNAQLNHWKCTLFVAAIDLPRYTDIRIHLLNVMKKNSSVTLDRLLDEVEGMNTLHKESSLVQAQSKPQAIYSISKDSAKKNTAPEARNREGKCIRCGTDHADKCFYKDKECLKCGKIGHKASCCKTRTKDGRHRRIADVKSVQCATLTRPKYVESFRMNGRTVEMKIDSGSDLTFIPEGTWRSIGSPRLTECHQDTKCANGLPLDILGTFKGTIRYGKSAATGQIYVTRSNITLVGMDFAGKLGFRIMHRSEMKGQTNCLSIQVNNPSVREDCAKKTQIHGHLDKGTAMPDEVLTEHSREQWNNARFASTDHASQTDSTKQFHRNAPKTTRSKEKPPEVAGKKGCMIWKIPQGQKHIIALAQQQGVNDVGLPEEREEGDTTELQHTREESTQILSLTPRYRFQNTRYLKRMRQPFIASDGSYTTQKRIECVCQDQGVIPIPQSRRKRSPGNTDYYVGQLVIGEMNRDRVHSLMSHSEEDHHPEKTHRTSVQAVEQTSPKLKKEPPPVVTPRTQSARTRCRRRVRTSIEPRREMLHGPPTI